MHNEKGGQVAHLARHWICDREVMGSSLTHVSLRSNLGQVYTDVLLSPNSISWYRLNSCGVNRQTERCTSLVSVVSQCKLVFG